MDYGFTFTHLEKHRLLFHQFTIQFPPNQVNYLEQVSKCNFTFLFKKINFWCSMNMGASVHEYGL